MALLALTAVTVCADIPYAPVMVYYDQTSPSDNDGKISANALRNLLGHFKTAVDMTNVSSYTTGQLDRYEAVFYVGSAFDVANIPAAFKSDVLASTNTVVWMNFNLWRLPGVVEGTSRLGIQYTYGNSTNAYETVLYGGQELYRNTNSLIVKVSVSTNFVEILATATSRVNPSLPPVPYLVRSSNFWYVADNAPRSQFLADRSLVLADLLHVILKAGTSSPRRALARIEDIAPALTSKTDVRNVSAALSNAGVIAAFGIIPRYRDPLGTKTNDAPDTDVPMSENRDFLRTLQVVLRNGGVLTDHGYTHESGDAESGSGYEFWDNARTNPLPYDSWAWCNGRVTNGLTELLTCGFPVTCWETPHYEASLLDYAVFPETYRVSHERMRNYGFFTENMSHADLESASTSNHTYSSQWFPYVIHKSCYGNMVLPENIDRYSTNATDPNGLFLTISNKIDYARKLTVVRDVVAAFYFHPQYGEAVLTNIVRQVAALGYTFASPADLSREEPVAIHTNDAWAASNTVRTFTATTNLLADLVVGDAGAGNLVVITNGGTVANEGACLGAQAHSYSNAVSVDGAGSTWTSRRTVIVGRQGSENGVTVKNGGNVQAPETVIGFLPGSSYNGAIVRGTDSVLSNRYRLTVGYGAAACKLVVFNGGRAIGQYGEIGATTNAHDNMAAILGAGSVWSNSHYVVVGNAGAANTLLIQESGCVYSTFGFVGARSTASSNTVTVTGSGSCWTNTASLMIGVDGRFNILTISNSACVSCANAVVGDYDNAGGNRIDIQGSNALLAVQQELAIGADGFENEVRVATGGLLQCGSIVVGRDNAGPGNMLTITGGAVTVAGAVQARLGRLNLAAGSLQADSVWVANGSRADLAAGFDLQAGVITNQGVVTVPPEAALRASVVLSGNGRLDIGTGSTLRVYGDFLSSSTNTAWSFAAATLAFSTSATHRLSLGAVDRGPRLNGFHANRALGGLTVEGEVIVTNVVYVWTLSGSGTLRIRPGSRVYYLAMEGWTGSVIAEGDGQRVPVLLTIDSIGPTTGAAMRLSWASASSLTFTVGWADRLLPTPVFSNAASLLSVSSNQDWTDIGATNRPHPSAVTQRFYRIDVRQ